MINKRLSDSTVSAIRMASILLGFILIVAAFLSDKIGLSIGGGFSSNQIGFIAAGAVLIFAGFMGRKFPGFYRGVALILMNLVVVIVLFEFFSLVLVKIIDPERFRIPAMKIEELGTFDNIESPVVVGKYAPFVIWRSNPEMTNDSVTVSNEGYRVTPGSSRDSDAYLVFLFGGSAMWGVNVPDSCTIGAYLQRDLTEITGKSIAVRNMAQLAHSSTQEIIELMLQLRSGNVPDIVIFYDGFNDVWGAYESGIAGAHHTLKAITERVEGSPEAFGMGSPIENLINNSNTSLLFTTLKARGIIFSEEEPEIVTYSTMGIDADSLSEEIARLYYGNCGVVDALAEVYGFEYMIIWQPNIWCGEKPLTDYEKTIYEGEFEFFPAGRDPDLKALLVKTYEEFENSITDSEHFFSFENIFDRIEDEVYNDYAGVHVRPWANELIAEEILRLLP